MRRAKDAAIALLVVAALCFNGWGCNGTLGLGGSSQRSASAAEYRYCLRYKSEAVRERCMRRIDARYERHEREVTCRRGIFGGVTCTETQE